MNPGLVIHGAARGADVMAGSIAKNLEIPVRTFPADWERWGRKAGIVRNQAMLDVGKPDYVLAFHDDIQHSKGTGDMVGRAKAHGVPGRVVDSQGSVVDEW